MKRRKDRRGGRRNNSGRKKKRVTGADGRAVGLESGGSSSILGSRPVDEVDGDGGDDDNGTELDEGLDISAAIDLANEGDNDVVEEFDQVREQEDNGEQALDREFDGTVIGDYHFEYEDEIDGKSVEYEGEIYGESAHIHSNNGIADDVDEPFGRISDNFVSLNNFDSDVDDDEELDDNDDTDSAEVEIPAVHTEYLRSVLADVKNEHSKIHNKISRWAPLGISVGSRQNHIFAVECWNGHIAKSILLAASLPICSSLNFALYQNSMLPGLV